MDTELYNLLSELSTIFSNLAANETNMVNAAYYMEISTVIDYYLSSKGEQL